jgi:hypothetical protein
VFYEVDAVASLLSAPDAITGGSFLLEGTGQWVGGIVALPGNASSVVRVVVLALGPNSLLKWLSLYSSLMFVTV